MIFVFGSNESGIHGAGAARTALDHHGARMGVGFGKQGQSFAIPTKNWKIDSLEIESIRHYVRRFIVFARMSPTATFKVTALGTGLAGIPTRVMAEMFKYAPDNCLFDEQWKEYLPGKKFWGTF